MFGETEGFGGRSGLMRLKFRLKCEVVEEGLHFTGRVGVFGSVRGIKAIFQTGDGFVGAA
jgi:hypothetical protein